MNIFDILKNLYTNRSNEWLLDINNSDIQPFLINKWLSMNSNNIRFCKYLDGYTFSLQPKQWLYLAHIVIPKQQRTPFVKYIKKKQIVSDYEELMDKIYDFLGVKGSDKREVDKRISFLLDDNLVDLMKFFGMEKKFWKKYGLDYNDMKVEDEKRIIKKGLDLWM